jgi:hypothetical protein
MDSSVVGNGMFGIAMNEYSRVHSSRLHEVRHAALPQRLCGSAAGLRRRSRPSRQRRFMRHPLISFATWTTVVAVVSSALWLALIEEQIRSKGDHSPRSIGIRIAGPVVRGVEAPRADARVHDWRAATPNVIASSADPANPPAAVRAQTLAWTR